MKRSCNIVMSFTLIIVVFLTCIYGCARKTSEVKSPRHIDDSTPWYQCKKNVYSDGVNCRVDNSSAIYADKTCKVFYQDFDENLSDKYCSNLIFIDSNDNVKDIDLSRFFKQDEKYNFNTCFRNGDDYYAIINLTRNNDNYNSIYRIDYVGGMIEYVADFVGVKNEVYYIDKVISSDDKYFAHIYYLESNAFKDAFGIFDKDYNLLHEITVNNPVTKWALTKESKIISVMYDRSNVAQSFLYSAVFDVENGTEKRTSVSSDLLSKYNIGYTTDDGFCYINNVDMTLTKMNLETGKEEFVLDFNNSSINLFELQCSSLLYCSDDICMLKKDTIYPSESFDWTINTLIKEDRNPNAGKQILYVAPKYRLGSLAASAIESMNTTDEDTYIYVTMDYSTLVFNDYEVSEDSTVSQYNKMIALVSKLKQDIRNEIAPDIILDFAEYSSLNNSDYLYDLKSVVDDKSRFNRDDYFDNIFDAYVKDDKLYQLPVSACVGGIYASDMAVNDSRFGFTYDEYKEFVQSECNGIDPLEHELGRSRCFDAMVKNNYDKLYDTDNHLSINNKTFRDLANFVRDMNDPSDVVFNSKDLKFVEFYRIHFDLSRLLINENKQLYGLPSENGNSGPIVFPLESIGICSSSNQFDRAFEFVRSILSYDVQIKNVVCNPVNKEAFSHYAEEAVTYSNSWIQNHYQVPDYNDSSIINEYIEYICSANTSYMCDDYSLLIMNEELQPFFYHQKEIDEIIPIIEKRVNNMIEELK